MNYYKIIVDNNIVGAVNSTDFRCHQKKHNLIISCDENKGEFVQYKETLYKAGWFLWSDINIPFVNAEVVIIEQDEYDELLEALKTEDEIYVEPVEPDIVIQEDEIDTLSLDYIKEIQIKKLTKSCQEEIEHGFFLKFNGDDEGKLYTLTVQDQLNLQSAQMQILNGATLIPYHAAGEETTYYAADDILAIIDASIYHKEYLLATLNSLKRYINSLNDKRSILDMTLNTEIPEEYQNEVLLDIYNQNYAPATLSKIGDLDNETEDFFAALLGEENESE